MQETVRQLTHIGVNIVLIIILVSQTLQFIENRHNYEAGEDL